MQLPILSTLLALHLAVANGALSKPALWPNLGKFSPDLTAGLPMPGYQVTQWPAGTISQGCLYIADRDGQDPAFFRAYSVLLNDSWNFCIQDGSKQSIDDLAFAFGQAPIRLRQYTSEVVMQSQGGGANAQNQIITLYQPATVQLFLHEMSHCADSAGGYKTPSSSASTAWSSSYDLDSAVPDTYAQTNQQENFAQFGGLIVYDRLTGGKLRDEPNLWEIGHQLNTMVDEGDNGQHGGRMYDFDSGLICSGRYANSPPVTMGSFVQSVDDKSQLDFIASFDLDKQVAFGSANGITVETLIPETGAPTQCFDV
ncbi:hypothetical protein PFICI_00725 [Pestalotiopsis fici W106-1]|uniref:Uncharacterized protein n=1 Tax=Pestalotiopsis fici (strain W106-1 / CGMCC3.15140) TaxID=1229662 RepID=W3XN09_PESFW|nr:uncharacterized protein PFICI_00725 [Pestalotiopsis fici W106-1]ETS86897.1 hypothetical protein PFICI_00725 [Pestalotiopsis fici W106-1]